MEGDERVVVRLSKDDVDLLFSMATPDTSASAIVRKIVEDYLDGKFSPEERAEVIASAAKRRSADPNRFTANGDDAEKILSGVITRGINGKDE